MGVIRNLVVKIGADISSLQKGLQDAQKGIQGASRSLQNTGAALTKGVTLPLAALGTLSVKTAADFEQSMANAASVCGATGDEFARMEELARQMGAATVFSASEAADAMYYMASAGYKVTDMESSLNSVLDLAAATQTDLASATDAVIATINQFGLESKDAGKVTNVFAAAISNSQATMEKLTYSMRYAGPVANSLGYSIEDTTAALALLYNAGFQGEQAGTILRSALSKLIKPTKEMETTATKLGISIQDLNPATHSLSEIMKTLEGTSLGTADAVALFGQEAGPGMMALLAQGSNALDEMAENLTGTNKASEMAKRQTETFEGQLKLLKSAFEEVCITIGGTLIPILSDLLNEYVKPAIDKFNSLDQETQKNIVSFGLLAAALGPVLSFGGKIVGAIGSITGAASNLTAALGGAGGAGGLIGSLSKIPGLFGPIGIAIGLGVSAFITLWNTSEEFRDGIMNALNDVWKAVQSCFSKMGIELEDLGDLWDMITGALVGAWQLFCGIIGPTISTAIKQVCIILEAGFKIIGGIFDLFSGLFTGNWEKMWNGVVSIFDGLIGGIWKTIKNFFSGIIDTIGGVIDWIGGFFNWGGNTTLEVKVPDNIQTSSVSPTIIGGYAAGMYGPAVNTGGVGPVAGVNINIKDNTFSNQNDIDYIGEQMTQRLKTAGVYR